MAFRQLITWYIPNGVPLADRGEDAATVSNARPLQAETQTFCLQKKMEGKSFFDFGSGDIICSCEEGVMLSQLQS